MPHGRGHRNRNPQILTGSFDGPDQITQLQPPPECALVLGRLNESATQELRYPELIVNDTRMATIDITAASIGSHALNPGRKLFPDDLGVKKGTIASVESSDERKSTRMRDSEDHIPREALKMVEEDLVQQHTGWVGGSTPSALADSNSCTAPASIPQTMPMQSKQKSLAAIAKISSSEFPTSVQQK